MGIKSFLLSHEPFRPDHMGEWIRMFYFRHYAPRFFPKNAQSLLDAGTGRGAYAVATADMFPNSHITAVDIVIFKEWSTWGRKNISFAQGDLTKLDEVNAYDAIFSIDVLEHIPHNEEVIAKLYSALRPGGVLYLAVPCESTEIHIFPQKWFGRFHEWEEHEHIGEMRPLGEVKKILVQLGFTILISRCTFTFWGMLAWEIETLLSYRGRWGDRINIILMPFYKFLGILDLYLPVGTGNNLIIAKKPNETDVEHS